MDRAAAGYRPAQRRRRGAIAMGIVSGLIKANLLKRLLGRLSNRRRT
ncbi:MULTISPECIES: hypothetical protein [unclassified Modestobacter]